MLVMKNIITIAGSIGSGKSSTAKAVAQALGYKHFSSGDLFRQIASDRGVSIEAINQTAETQKDIDAKVDKLLQELYRNEDSLVVDSRMAWHWMPCAFKVFLLLEAHTAAERIFSHVQKEGRMSESATSVEEVFGSIERRFQSEQKRYFDLYGVDPTDVLNFDIVISTKKNDLATVTAMILAAYEAWRNSQKQL